MLMSSSMPSSSSTSHTNCEQSVPQQQHQQSIIESDSINHLNATSTSTTEDRISPNIFLNLNFDNTSMDQNSLKFEWSTFNPNIPPTTVPSTMSFKYQQSNSYISTSPTYEFLNVDHFNIDSFKNECMLSLDQTILNSVNDGQALSTDNMTNFTMEDDGKDLLDLEKPININIGNLESEKYC